MYRSGKRVEYCESVSLLVEGLTALALGTSEVNLPLDVFRDGREQRGLNSVAILVGHE